MEYNKDKKPKEDIFKLDFKAKPNEASCEATGAKFCSTLNQPIYSGKMLNKINFQINYLIDELFEPLGFDLLKFTRLPYLCEGNMQQSFYYLHDYVFVFKSNADTNLNT